jgi:hypothetical protein
MNFLDLFPKYDIGVIVGIILINYKSHNLRFMVNMEKEKDNSSQSIQTTFLTWIVLLKTWLELKHNRSRNKLCILTYLYAYNIVVSSMNMLWHVQILWCDVRFVNSIFFPRFSTCSSYIQQIWTRPTNEFEVCLKVLIWWSNMYLWLQAINVPWMLILESPIYSHLAHFFDIYFFIAKHMLKINLNDNKIVYIFNFVGEHFKGSNLFKATILFSYVANGLFVFFPLLSSIWKIFSWHFSIKSGGPKLCKIIFH